MRLRSVLLAAALLPAVACAGGAEGIDKKTSCDRMKNAITSIGTLQSQLDDTSPEDFSRIYSNAATEIRTTADASTDDDVKSVGLQLAGALDLLAKATTSGESSGSPEALEASGKLATAATTFEKHCGPVTT